MMVVVRSITIRDFEVYVDEVKSQALHWSPAHTDGEFWSTNVEKFCEDQCVVLKYDLAQVLVMN